MNDSQYLAHGSFICHYGVKGMKWGKNLKAKADEISQTVNTKVLGKGEDTTQYIGKAQSARNRISGQDDYNRANQQWSITSQDDKQGNHVGGVNGYYQATVNGKNVASGVRGYENISKIVEQKREDDLKNKHNAAVYNAAKASRDAGRAQQRNAATKVNSVAGKVSSAYRNVKASASDAYNSAKNSASNAYRIVKTKAGQVFGKPVLSKVHTHTSSLRNGGTPLSVNVSNGRITLKDNKKKR